MRTSSKVHMCSHPTPVLRHNAVVSGGESEVMIIPKISNGLSVFPLCDSSSVYLLLSVCVCLLSAISDMDPFWRLGDQSSPERAHPLIPLNK